MIQLDLIPMPYRLLGGAVVALAVIVGTYAFGHSHGAAMVQARWDAASLAQAEAAAEAEAESREKERSFQQQLNEARNAATEREKKLRADADAARTAALGLRDTVAALRGQLSAASPETCRRIAGAAVDVFDECADAYRAVAEAADRFGSSAQTLNDGWPQ